MVQGVAAMRNFGRDVGAGMGDTRGEEIIALCCVFHGLVSRCPAACPSNLTQMESTTG